MYLLGYAIVNNQPDTRLKKALKGSTDNPQLDATQVVQSSQDTGKEDLIQACAALKQTVIDLQRTVKQLQRQYLDMQRRLPASLTGDRNMQASDRESDASSDDSSGDESGAESAVSDSEGVTAVERHGENIIVPQLEPGGNSGDQQSVDSGFRLSQREPRRIRRGRHTPQVVNKTPIVGTATTGLRIKAASIETSMTRTVYVGNEGTRNVHGRHLGASC